MRWCSVNSYHCPTHHYVPSMDELQARLEDSDVQDVDEVTQVVSKQPVVNVVWRVVGECPTYWDEPNVPIPSKSDQKHPQHIHKVWEEGETDS